MREDTVQGTEEKKKEGVGNQKSIYTVLGAPNHSMKERHQDDYYVTEPKALELLLQEEEFASVIWECACGEGHLSKVLEAHGYDVVSMDLIYRGCGHTESVDFLKAEGEFVGDIITNPPYKYALEFAKKALDSVEPGRKVAMFLKLQFLEGKRRKQFFMDHPPRTVYVSSSRLICAMNGEFEKYPSSAVAYAWFVWEKGFAGDPVIKWIN